MPKVVSRVTTLGRRLRARLARYLPSRRANVAAIVALCLPVLAGIMGLAMEGSNWFLNQRAQQNAADAAVVAAANQALQDYYLNNDSWSSTNYTYEGGSVAKNYGYVNNTGGTTVSVLGGTNKCPPTFSNTSGFYCFQATISKTLPLYMTRLVGYKGTPGANGQTITATAFAGAISVPAPVCFTALRHGSANGNDYGFTNSGQGANFAGCPIGTNDGAKCSAVSQGVLQVPYMITGNATQDKNSCSGANVTLPSSDYLTDPYVNSDTHIPTASQCGGSSITGGGSTTPAAITSAQANGTTSCVLIHIINGNLTLTPGSTVNVTGQQIWVIQNGVLNMNGATLETGGGSPTGSGGLAVIFTGGPPSGVSNTNGSIGYVQGGSGSVLNISSIPTVTDSVAKYFSGDTLYQDPTPWGGEPGTPGARVYQATYDGNSNPFTWKLSGVVYMPNADYTLNGAMQKADNGYNCFNMVVDTMSINGGGVSGGTNGYSLFSTPLTQCGQQGSLSVVSYGYRFALVG